RHRRGRHARPHPHCYGAKLARRQPIQPRDCFRRAAARRLRAMDPAGARTIVDQSGNPGRHERRRRDAALRDRDRSRHGENRAPRLSHRGTGIRLFGASQAGRPYWYRFLSGDAVSAIGRAITLPAAETAVEKIRFGFVSCSNYEHGYFSAYRHLTGENPEFVLFLGDYIYETIEQFRPIVRRHSDGVEAATLPTYRNRYAQYRLDADLQELHAQVPAIVTWDDHEVQNDYADKWSETFDDPAQFLMRRAAAYQAFYEHMPVRPIIS